MLTRFHAVILDANDVGLVAGFWRDAAGFNLNGESLPHFAVLRPVNDSIPKFIIIKVPESKVTKNRVHFDFAVDDLDDERERLEGLGARFDADREWDGTKWIVMQDPEGNEFCLVEASSDE